MLVLSIVPSRQGAEYNEVLMSWEDFEEDLVRGIVEFAITATFFDTFDLEVLAKPHQVPHIIEALEAYDVWFEEITLYSDQTNETEDYYATFWGHPEVISMAARGMLLRAANASERLKNVFQAQGGFLKLRQYKLQKK